MTTFIVRRLIMAVVVIFIVSLFSFFLVQLVPGGDPARVMLGLDASQDEVNALRTELWLDRPVMVQYFHWMGNALHGEFGKSLIYRENVRGLIATRLPITFQLSATALIVAALLGITAGVVCAVKRGSALDQVISVLANTGISIPIFWLGILGIYFFGLLLGWLPIQGYTSPGEDLLMNIKQLIMPVICMAMTNLAITTRQTRSAMLEVTRQDYIRTAYSKGLAQRMVVIRHALKNALIPIVTLLGMTLPSLVAGSVLIETVFNIPGMGRLLVRAVFDKDFLIVQAGVLIIASLIAIVNLLVDISYGFLDPRIRYQ
jgi:peptide/nickel transport system permease protein